MQIFIKDPSGVVHCVEVDPSASIDSLKDLIGKTTGIAAKEQILMVQFGANEAVYTITVSKASGLSFMPFSSAAPDYHSVSSGLNLIGPCTNASCSAFGATVIIECGINPDGFELTNCAICPICKKPVCVESCGFYNCQWRYEGYPLHGAYVQSEWTVCCDQGFSYIDEKDCDVAEWLKLVIFTKPL